MNWHNRLALLSPLPDGLAELSLVHETLYCLEAVVPRVDEACHRPHGPESQLQFTEFVDVVVTLVPVFAAAGRAGL